jgi:hypothetical protein
MSRSKQSIKKSEYKAFTLCCVGIIMLSELATWLSILPGLYTALIHIIFFPVFVICLFLWLSASEKERDIPFIGY